MIGFFALAIIFIVGLKLLSDWLDNKYKDNKKYIALEKLLDIFGDIFEKIMIGFVVVIMFLAFYSMLWK